VYVVLKEFSETMLFMLRHPFSFEVNLAGRLALVLNFKPFIYAI
jgi:hypothetical protein